MIAPQYMVHAKFPDNYAKYECKNIDDVQDALFMVATNNGKITWVGKKHILGYIDGYQMYEYREIQEAYK